MTTRPQRITSSWLWLLTLYSVASFIETIFWGQMSAFTPLYLPRLGIAEANVAAWTGLIVSISGAIGVGALVIAARQGTSPDAQVGPLPARGS